jgi:hypothetical protein
MLKERQAEALDEWLKCARESGIRELISFANGISKDYAAVRAARLSGREQWHAPRGMSIASNF